MDWNVNIPNYKIYTNLPKTLGRESAFEWLQPRNSPTLPLPEQTISEITPALTSALTLECWFPSPAVDYHSRDTLQSRLG